MKFKKSCLILLTIMSLAGTCYSTSANTKPHHVYLNDAVHVNKNKQYKHQNNKKLVKKVKKQVKKSSYYKLDKKQYKARKRIAYMESRYDWNASNGKCFGRYQLLPAYLGYTHGHLNLGHKHQVQVANNYVYHRYGTWTNALRFHLIHNWY